MGKSSGTHDVNFLNQTFLKTEQQEYDKTQKYFNLMINSDVLGNNVLFSNVYCFVFLLMHR